LKGQIESNWMHTKNSFLPRWTSKHRGVKFESLGVAKMECLKMDECGGVTLTGNKYELRKGNVGRPSFEKEESWIKSGIIYKSLY